MSQRVAMLIGNTKGIDQVFWPIVKVAGGLPDLSSYPENPAGVDEATYMRWAWRVKKWLLSGTTTFTGTLEGVSVTYSLTFGAMFAPMIMTAALIPAVSEQDILKDWDGGVGGLTRSLLNRGYAMAVLTPNFTISGGAFTITSQSTNLFGHIFEFSPSFPAASPTYLDTVSGLYYPNLSITLVGTLHVHSSTTGATYSVPVTMFTDGGSHVPSGTGLVVDGVSVPLQTNFFGTAYSADWTLDPLEFWPFKTKGGLAVYDTATGAQINDPLS